MSWASNLKRKKKQDVVKNISAEVNEMKITQNREMINKAKYWFYKIKIRNSLWNQFLTRWTAKIHQVSISASLFTASVPPSCASSYISLLCVSWKVVCEYSLNEQSTQLIKWPYSICHNSYSVLCLRAEVTAPLGSVPLGPDRAGFATQTKINTEKGTGSLTLKKSGSEAPMR